MMAKTCLPPGFRFHPTDVELVWYYLKRKITGKPCRFEAISEVQVYKFAPWDLPDKSCLVSKDLEWYFFCARDRKYSCGSRTNRATDTGYWKPTGRDRPIDYNSQKVGMKKTLIFHLGKFPKGTRTDWVMYEYRLDSSELANAGYAQDAYVICKIFEKSGRGPRNGAQYGAPFNEEDWEDDTDMQSHFEVVHSFSLTPPINNFEVGEPSCMQRHLEFGESSAMTCNLEAGEAYADSLSLKEVETFLLAETTNVDEMPDMDFENFFGLSDPSCLEPKDGIAISDIQPEFVDEHYDDIFNDYLETDVDGYFARELPSTNRPPA